MEMGSPTVPPYVAGPIELSAFRALSLAPRRVGDPASARAFARPYRAVAQRLEAWCRRGHAVRDDEPALYLHEFTDSGLTIRGLVGCLELSHLAGSSAERRIYPHEGVHPRQVDELAKRMAEMRVNPAPILLVHRGPEHVRELMHRVRTEPPLRAYLDHAGQEHRVWAIRDLADQAVVGEGLARSRLLVADGHHRYAAYVAMHQSAPTSANARGLAMVVDQQETPFFLGAIHRVLHGTRVSDLIDAGRSAGAEIGRVPVSEAISALGPHTVVVTDGESAATLQLPSAPGRAVVQVFDTDVVERLRKRPHRISFAHRAPQALEQARPGRTTVALLPAVDFDVVTSVVRSGALLPEKATSFQPKPSLGSFIRLLDE